MTSSAGSFFVRFVFVFAGLKAIKSGDLYSGAASFVKGQGKHGSFDGFKAKL